MYKRKKNNGGQRALKVGSRLLRPEQLEFFGLVVFVFCMQVNESSLKEKKSFFFLCREIQNGLGNRRFYN
ncbi:hypothetical protein, partial [Neisseria meningitidis]|uniref:hypothetical protein n=1 Tax=Neisseria meningitidis TaxID=487 RepID=UPI000CCB6F71